MGSRLGFGRGGVTCLPAVSLIVFELLEFVRPLGGEARFVDSENVREFKRTQLGDRQTMQTLA